MNSPIKNIVFDLGGVLVDWNPRYLYKKIFSSTEMMESFLTEVCTPQWNEEQDGGRLFTDGVKELVSKFPNFENEIRAYDLRWEEMLAGAIEPTVDILEKICDNGAYKVLALSNWSQEKFPIAEKKFSFLKRFEDIIVSGKIGLKKPDPEIFNYLCKKHSLLSQETLFIDDSKLNIDSATQLGFKTIHFQSSDQLGRQLCALGILN